MNRMQKYLARAATELKLRVDIGFEFELTSGLTLVSQARLPDLGGNQFATLAFRWEDGISSGGDAAAAIRSELRERGYAVSTFDEPLPNEQFDLQGYIEMFSDWGWSGPADQKPAWMS